MFKFLIIGIFIGFLFAVLILGIVNMARDYLDDGDEDYNYDLKRNDDFYFFIKIILIKLGEMKKYMKSINQDKIASQISTEINLLNIAFEEDKITNDKDLQQKNIYVNTINNKRFYNSRYWQKDENYNSIHDSIYNKTNLRQLKARNIVFKYLSHHVEEWWI